MRRSPLEMMVDQACGFDPNEERKETPDPAKILLSMADASADWYKNETAPNFERMKEAIKTWIDIGG